MEMEATERPTERVSPSGPFAVASSIAFLHLAFLAAATAATEAAKVSGNAVGKPAGKWLASERARGVNSGGDKSGFSLRLAA